MSPRQPKFYFWDVVTGENPIQYISHSRNNLKVAKTVLLALNQFLKHDQHHPSNIIPILIDKPLPKANIQIIV